jgi:heme exporter protein B
MLRAVLAEGETVWVLLRKDLLSEWRTREASIAALVFALMVLLAFNFAFDLRLGRADLVAPGVLWTTFLFSGLLALGRGFARERDRGTLEGLLIAPIDRGAIYLSKLLANTLFVLLVEAVTLPLFAALFSVTFDWPRMALISVLGALGFCGVGTLFAAMASHTRAREVLLPVLLLPIALPVIIATVRATSAAVGPSPVVDDLPWLNLLLAFDAIFIALSYLVFDAVVGE